MFHRAARINLPEPRVIRAASRLERNFRRFFSPSPSSCFIRFLPFGQEYTRLPDLVFRGSSQYVVIRRISRVHFAEGKSQHRPKTRNDVLFYQSQSNFVTGESKRGKVIRSIRAIVRTNAEERGKFPRWRGHRLLPTSTLLPSIKHPDDDRNERC